MEKKNYISKPRNTGYRGIHLKYRFSGKANSEPWNNLKIEIQIRTKLQHRWATAVEAVGAFTKQALKSNQGGQEWLRFFSLISSVYALREECTPTPKTPQTFDDLYKEIRHLNNEFRLDNILSGYTTIIPHMQSQTGAKYFLVTLDPVNMLVNIRGFKDNESQKANTEYINEETRLKGTNTQVVLVSVSSVNMLKRAYPNYFLDTQEFLSDVNAIMSNLKVAS